MSARVANAEMPFESNQKERQSSASDCWSSLFLRGKWPTERNGSKVYSRRRSRRPAGSTPSAKSNPSTLLPPLFSGIWLGSSSTTTIVSSKSDISDGHASSKYPNPFVCITAPRLEGTAVYLRQAALRVVRIFPLVFTIPQ